MKKTLTTAKFLSLALTTACLLSTQVHRLEAAETNTPAWTDQSAVRVMRINKQWLEQRWSKSQTISLQAVNTLLDAGVPADAWQYQKLAAFADDMQTCTLLAMSVEGTSALVTDKANRVLALDGLLDTYRVSIRVRIDGVRDGLEKAQKFSRVPDVRQAAGEILKMVNEFDKNVVMPRVRELEELQKTVGKPPKAAVTK